MHEAVIMVMPTLYSEVIGPGTICKAKVFSKTDFLLRL